MKAPDRSKNLLLTSVVSKTVENETQFCIFTVQQIDVKVWLKHLLVVMEGDSYSRGCEFESHSWKLNNYFSYFFFYFRLFNTQLTVNKCSIQINFYRRLNSNRTPLVMEATALPTEPQPLPNFFVVKLCLSENKQKGDNVLTIFNFHHQRNKDILEFLTFGYY